MGPLVDGTLERVLVRDGERVVAGQVVATLVSDELRREEERLLTHLACDSMTCVLLREASRIRLRSAGLDEADLAEVTRTGPSGRIRLRATADGVVRLHSVAPGTGLSWRDDILSIESATAHIKTPGGDSFTMDVNRWTKALSVGDSVWIWALSR